MERELELTLIAGHKVKFVYLDSQGNESLDSEFIARCRFLPGIGEKVELGANKATAFVKRIYHAFVENAQFEEGVLFQAVTVVLTTEDSVLMTEASLPERVSH